MASFASLTSRALPSALQPIEKELATFVPFANPDYINKQVTTRYKARLHDIAQYSIWAKDLDAQLSSAAPARCISLLGDPSLRSSIDALVVARGSSANNDCAHSYVDETLASAAECAMSSDAAASPLGVSCGRLGIYTTTCVRALIWSEQYPATAPTNRLRSLYKRFGPAGYRLATPEPVEIAMLNRSIGLLADVLPNISSSSLAHVHTMAVIEELPESVAAPLRSFTCLQIPRTIFIARSALTTCEQIAECVLHEALHEKWYDLQHTHAMLMRGYNPAQSPKIRSIWNRPAPMQSNEWPICRSVAAFHVYVYLALYFRLLGILQTDGAGATHFQSAIACSDRAVYLSQNLHRYDHILDIGGKHFIKWLDNTLRSLTLL